ncbi:MAG TPA: hypothetical protein VGX92_13660 [Pyrinomonadaceae bacterium]|jgi:hypothetical protein|nr:hypothetical protein [Pyrinomonadaceae bacterium]
MSNIKIILTTIAVVLGVVVALAAIGMVITAIQYLFWLAVLCLAVFGAVKLFGKSDSPRLEGRARVDELKSADHTLEEYKRKYLSK